MVVTRLVNPLALANSGLPVATGALDEASYRVLAKHKVEIASGTREIG